MTRRKETRTSEAQGGSRQVSGGNALEGMVPMITQMQRVVSKNMTSYHEYIPGIGRRDILMDNSRSHQKPPLSKGITVQYVIGQGGALAIEKHPIINSSFRIKVRQVHNKDINIAWRWPLMVVSLPDPHVRQRAQQCGRARCENWKELVGKGQDWHVSLRPSAGHFAISNMGMFGVTHFEPSSR
jgi:pyruvate/2-oxoglutarate dehydrogenase complex dihydrolipoamide acyltransferase (E2) component